MQSRPNYDMTLDELDRFIARCETLDVHFNWGWFTGGEATLWPGLIGGIERLAASPSFGNIRIKTNGAEIERLAPVMDKVAGVVWGVHPVNVKKAVSFIGEPKLGFWSEPHRVVPDEPIPDTSPAGCICPVAQYYDGRVYACPGPVQVLSKLGRPFDGPDVSCDVEEDFLAFYLQNAKTRCYQDICQQCLSNGKVYRHQKHTQEDAFDLLGVPAQRGRKDM